MSGLCKTKPLLKPATLSAIVMISVRLASLGGNFVPECVREPAS